MPTVMTPHMFEIPTTGNPKPFTGFLVVGFAGDRWWSGLDTNDANDAYNCMVDAARLAMVPAAHVDKKLDPSFHPATVQCFRIQESA